jgi:cysteine desulfurase family protein (TIGR01976 family)
MPLDLPTIRAAFPALSRTADGRPCVFADAPGGTQVPGSVADAMSAHLLRSNANLGGAFPTCVECSALVEDAREAAADLVGASPDEVVFGPNMTTLAFSLSRAVARDLRPGDEVVVTLLDHDANIAPWLLAAEDAGAAVRWVDILEDDCAIDPEGLERALGPRTRVVAVTGASNALGTVTDLPALIRLVRARSPDALVVVDAVHLAPHRAIDVVALDADILFCSAYKFFGPHLGLMFGRRDRLEALRPYKVRPAEDAAPWRWETGTLNHEGLAGLVATVGHVAGVGRDFGRAEGAAGREAVLAGMAAIEEHEARLSARFLERLDPGAIRLFGIDHPGRVAARTPTFALRVGDRHPREVAE